MRIINAPSLLRRALRNSLNVMLNANDLIEMGLRRQYEDLLQRESYRRPGHLIPHGAKIYSQNDEDGIIREIFRRIGTANRRFVELGPGDGLENNTLALLFDGWSGVWLEGSPKKARRIRNGFSQSIASGRLVLIEAMVTAENINDLLSPAIQEKELDLLSIDIDGNDIHVLNAITCANPRVIVIEYNAKFPPPILYCMQYNPRHVWDETDCFGASLAYLEKSMEQKGYRLVGCNISGSNAFFVRGDLTGDRFLAPFTAENHYEPARYFMRFLSSGHRSSYATLETSSGG